MGCGIEAAHKATCSQAKDAQPAWHGAESAQGCGVSGENVVGGRRLSPSDFDLESNGEGMMIGKARKAGRGHLEEKRIIHPMSATMVDGCGEIRGRHVDLLLGMA